jgi:hypothetical protein
MKPPVKFVTLEEDLSNGWILRSESSSVIRAVPPRAATDPRTLSNEGAFGDFNLPLGDEPACVTIPSTIEDVNDIAAHHKSLREDEFEPYSDFRKHDLGL